MLDLATRSSHYRDLIAASPAGHREKDQVTLSTRDEFTGSFLSGLFWLLDSCGCLVCALMLRPCYTVYDFESYLNTQKTTLPFIFGEAHPRVHDQELWLCKSSFPGLVLLCIFVSFHIACRYTGVWLERSVSLHVSYPPLLHFSLFHVISSHPLDILSHLHASMPASVLHSLTSVSTPITGSPTPERHTLFLLTCLFFSTVCELKNDLHPE